MKKLLALVLIGSLAISATSSAEDRVELYVGAHQQYDALKYATWDLVDAVNAARFPQDEAQRKRFISEAQRKLKAAQAALAGMQDAVTALERNGTWKESAKLFKERFERCADQIKKAEAQLQQLLSKKPPSKPSPPASPAPQPNHSPPAAPSRNPSTRPPAPTTSLELGVMLWELREMTDELLMWELYHEKELLGEGLLKRYKSSFKKYGVADTSGWTQPWAQHASMDTKGALSMYGDWFPLTKAISDFRYNLERERPLSLSPSQQQYVNYLRGGMKLWRKTIRRKKELKLKMIDCAGRLAAAADDEQEWNRLGAQSQALVQAIRKKAPIRMKPYAEWSKHRAALEHAR